MKTRQVVDSVALLCVVGSLVFVGLEVRQASNATKSATVQQIKDSFLQLNLASATNVELSRALVQFYQEGSESVSPVQREQVISYLRSIFHNTSNAYYQYRIGVLDDELWEPHLNEFDLIINRPLTRPVWDEVSYLYDQPFRELARELREGNPDDV